MNKIHAKRLLKLADFLHDLPRKHFDFNDIASGESVDDMKSMSCGSVGCAIGWTPALFPHLVEWATDSLHGGVSTIKIKGRQAYGFEETAQGLFDLSYDDVLHLFVPNSQNYGQPNLDEDALPRAVAKNIRHFVKMSYPELVPHIARKVSA